MGSYGQFRDDWVNFCSTKYCNTITYWCGAYSGPMPGFFPCYHQYDPVV